MTSRPRPRPQLRVWHCHWYQRLVALCGRPHGCLPLRSGHLMIGEARVIVAIQMIQTRSFAPVGSFKCLRNAAHTRERATRHSHTNIFDAVIFQIESRAAPGFQSRKQQNCWQQISNLLQKAVSKPCRKHVWKAVQTQTAQKEGFRATYAAIYMDGAG